MSQKVTPKVALFASYQDGNFNWVNENIGNFNSIEEAYANIPQLSSGETKTFYTEDVLEITGQ